MQHVAIQRGGSSAVPAVSRFERCFDLVSHIGSTPSGGVDRPALSDADIETHRLLLSWIRDTGWHAACDEIGNLFITRPGTDASASPVATGSHLDSQPRGGRFDGALGVLAGLEVFFRLDERGIETRRPLQLIVWMNEEGCRFTPTTMGSLVYVGQLKLAEIVEQRDVNGCRFGDELKKYFDALNLKPEKTKVRPHAYIEVHIEQGPILQNQGSVIGAVTGVQGIRQYTVSLHGEAAHAGTTPQRDRRDAFQSLIRIASALGRTLHDPDDQTRFTIGRCDTSPGSLNTIPHTAKFTIDLRHPSPDQLMALDLKVRETSQTLAPPCKAAVESLLDRDPLFFSQAIVDAIEAAALGRGHPVSRLASGATHDSAVMAQICPTGMIFIPCRNGISHREDEHAEMEHMLAAVDTLDNVLVGLANEEISLSSSQERASC
jgi:N-carbamoyl-L-amino-acid hydrolase